MNLTLFYPNENNGSKHQRDLNDYKLKVQAEYEAASQKFRQDSAIIANERQQIYELQHTTKFGKTRIDNEKLMLKLTQTQQMLKKPNRRSQT